MDVAKCLILIKNTTKDMQEVLLLVLGTSG